VTDPERGADTSDLELFDVVCGLVLESEADRSLVFDALGHLNPYIEDAEVPFVRCQVRATSFDEAVAHVRERLVRYGAPVREP
jgi:hypothetical protein